MTTDGRCRRCDSLMTYSVLGVPSCRACRESAGREDISRTARARLAAELPEVKR